jgi:hypothetical protein
MFLTLSRPFLLRKAHRRPKSSGGSAARRRLMWKPELEFLEDRLTPAGPANYTNLAVTGAVVVAGPAHDVKIEFSATPGSSFTLNGNAHDVTIIGGIPKGDSVTLHGDAHDVTIRGTVAGTFDLTGSGHDVTMGNVSGSVTLGSTPAGSGSLHDFRAGEVAALASFLVNDSFHDGTVGPLDAGSVTFFNPHHHSLKIR